MRSFSTLVALAVAPLFVSAAPLKRAAADILVAQFADVLEQLESQFYSQALAKFQDADFIAAGFTSAQVPIQLFQAIQKDEATHSVGLQALLKANGGAVISSSCKFDFSSALTDIPTMAATARLVENVGVSAYLGGATLITDPVILDIAGSILTVEARHQTMLNVLNSGSAIPASFDIPFSPSEVLAIAGPFISGCDTTIPANPTLAVTNTGSIQPGTSLTFSSAAINGTSKTDTMFCQMLVGGAAASIPLPFNQCNVPAGINGPVAVYVTSDGQPLVNNVRDRATTQLVAGPTLIFVDTVTEAIDALIKTGSTGTGTASGSVTTETISPEAASSLVAGSGSSTETASASQATGSSTASAASSGTTASASAATGSSTASAASSSTTAAASSALSSSTDIAAFAGGPNLYTGPSPNGAINVVGWNMQPTPPSSTTSAAAAASSTGAATGYGGY